MSRSGAGAARCVELAFEAGTGRRRVWGRALVSGGGLSVNLLGGDVPHIGAVAMAIPRPSLAARGRRSATTSVFAVVGHKEDELARRMAAGLARQLGVITVVVAGIHIARATTADIRAVVRNAASAQRSLAARIRRRGLCDDRKMRDNTARGRRGA